MTPNVTGDAFIYSVLDDGPRLASLTAYWKQLGVFSFSTASTTVAKISRNRGSFIAVHLTSPDRLLTHSGCTERSVFSMFKWGM